MRGCVVGEEGEGEEEGGGEGGDDVKGVELLKDSFLGGENDSKVQVKKEVEKEAGRKVEEGDKDESTLYLLVDSLFLLEELAMPSSPPYIPPTPPAPAPPSVPSSPSIPFPSTPSPFPTSLSPSLSTGPGLSVSSLDITCSPHTATVTDIGNGIGNGIGSEGTDISDSISIPITALSPFTSHSQIHSIPITNSVTVTVDTVGTVTVTVISSNGNGNGITEVESTTVNQEIENIKKDKQEGKEKKKNKLITVTIPAKKENENVHTQISSITITESVTDKTDLTGNTAKLEGGLVAGKKSSRKKKKERVEGVDYMELGLPRKNLNLVDDIVTLENMINEMQDEIFDDIDKEVEMEEMDVNSVFTSNTLEDKNNQINQNDNKNEKKDKKELKENTSDKMNNNELSANQRPLLSATLRVVGFDCEWRPEHYFERKIAYSNGGKSDLNGQNKSNIGGEGAFDSVDAQQIGGDGDGSGSSGGGGGVSDGDNNNSRGVDIVSSDVSLNSHDNSNNNNNNYNNNNININNKVSKSVVVRENTKTDKNKKQKIDEEVYGKRKLISPMGKKNRGSNKRNKMIDDIDNDFQDMVLISEYSEVAAKNLEIDRIENRIRARSDLRKLAADSDNLISIESQVDVDSLSTIDDNIDNRIDEDFMIDDNKDSKFNDDDDKNINSDITDSNDDSESKDEILRTNNTSWGRFDVPRERRRRDQTSKGTGTGPGPARMASPVMLLQVD